MSGGARTKDTWTKSTRTKNSRTKYTGQNVSGQNTHRTKYTGQKVPEHNKQDDIYQTKFTGQNIPDKIYWEGWSREWGERLGYRWWGGVDGVWVGWRMVAVGWEIG